MRVLIALLAGGLFGAGLVVADMINAERVQAFLDPFVLIGDLGGRLNLGDRYLRYPWYGKPGHRTIANFYLSLMQAAGMETPETFGQLDSNLKDLDLTGPLTELLA